MTWEYLIVSAILASFVKSAGKSFRQREVRFMTELFATWRLTPTERQFLPALHNNQIARFLEKYHQLGWLKVYKKNQPSYALSRAGLVGIIMELRDISLTASVNEFIFVHYLLQNYRPHLSKLFSMEKHSLPLDQKLEIEKILDSKHFISQKILETEVRIEYWKRRISETQQVAKLAEEKLSQNKNIAEVISTIEKSYPYEMNYSKPITQLVAEIPENLQRWEITEGNRLRSRSIWSIYLNRLELDLKILKSL